MTSITNELRLCEVDGEIGYFHTWEHFSNPIPAGWLHCGAPAGVASNVFGIVEFEGGVVRQVEPNKIKFCDETNNCLKDFNEMKWLDEKGE